MSYQLATSSLRGRLQVPYQRDGVQWLLKREIDEVGPKGGFLADDMGIGKTIQLIATILGNPQLRTLIIVPKSIVSQWVDEIKKFGPTLTVHTYTGQDRKIKEANIIITSYSILSSKKETTLSQFFWDRIILDEAHEIRNKSSQAFKSVCELKSSIRWVVSGTPVFNSMRDFVSLCTFFGLPKNVVQGRTSKIKETYILRRTKEDLAHANERLRLPPCHFENVELDMYPEEKKFYECAFLEAQETIRESFMNAQSISAKNMLILECLLRARQCMVLPQMYLDGIAKKNETEVENWSGRSKKMETLFEMVRQHPTEKTLIFCQFRGEMNHIQKSLATEAGPIYRIDGSVSSEERTRRIKAFKDAPPGAVFIIQIKCGGQGLNLQEATRVYITAPSWNPASELQAIGRAHRTGQTQKVYVKKLIYKATDTFVSVEEEMMALQGHKSIICSQVLNDERIKNQIPVKTTKDKISILDIKKIFKA